MSEGSLVAISSMFGAAVSAVSAIIVAKINHDRKRAQAEAEKTNKLLRELTNNVKSGNRVSVATARSVIAQIYDSNKENKSIDGGIFESVLDLYDGYKSIEIDGHVPNSWCDSMVVEMRRWKKV